VLTGDRPTGAPGYLREVLSAGNAHARELSAETLALVHERMHAIYG
jgi:hypothetical protein